MSHGWRVGDAPWMVAGDSMQQSDYENARASLHAPYGPHRLRLTATEGTRTALRIATLSLLGPVEAPSSAGSRRGKARMFERRDARVRAGRRVPSNAGNIDGFIVDARTSGAFSFGYFSFGQAKKSDSLARRDSE